MEPLAVNYYKLDVLFGSAWKSGDLSQGVEAMFDPATTTKSLKSSPKIRPYPPRVPESKTELERVICLLGNRTKAELNKKAHEELVALLGTYPTLKEAVVWKIYVKGVLKQKLQVEG